MKKTLDDLMLKRVDFGRGGGMNWRDRYNFFLRMVNDKVSFSGGDGKRAWGFSDVEVPATVMTDLSKIARDGGAVGTPVWVDPVRTMRVLDAPTSHFDLYWEDGSHTGPGTAAGSMLSYMRDLAEKCLRDLPEDDPRRHNKDDPFIGSVRFAGWGMAGNTEAAQNTFKNIQGGQEENTQEKWTCTNCNFPDNVGRFCSECGSPKPA